MKVKYQLYYYLDSNSTKSSIKEFDTLEEVRLFIKKFICEICLQHGESIHQMIKSSCGSYRFGVYDNIMAEETYLEALERFLNGDHKKCPYKNDDNPGNNYFYDDNKANY